MRQACTGCGGTERLAVTRERAELEWSCPICGAEVPTNFDACWQCQAMRPTDAPLNVLHRQVRFEAPPETIAAERQALPWRLLVVLVPGLALTLIKTCNG